MSSSGESARIGGANVEFVLEAFREFAERGPEAVIDILDPEVDVYGDEELANGGRFHGIPGYRRWTERWLDVWGEFEIEVELVEPVGERHVAATCHQTGLGKSSGASVEMDATYMFEISDGMVVRFHIYGDRRKAIAAAREGEATASDARPPAPSKPATD